jgi:hypothetical protein
MASKIVYYLVVFSHSFIEKLLGGESFVVDDKFVCKNV